MSAIPTPLSRRWSSPEVASLAARALVKHNMNATRAALELRPHLTEQSARKTGSRMIHTPAVQAELAKLVNHDAEDQNAQVFVKMLWEWLRGLHNGVKADGRVSSQSFRLGSTAATLLSRIYLKNLFETPPTEPNEPTSGGTVDDEIKALTGMG